MSDWFSYFRPPRLLEDLRVVPTDRPREVSEILKQARRKSCQFENKLQIKIENSVNGLSDLGGKESFLFTYDLALMRTVL